MESTKLCGKAGRRRFILANHSDSSQVWNPTLRSQWTCDMVRPITILAFTLHPGWAGAHEAEDCIPKQQSLQIPHGTIFRLAPWPMSQMTFRCLQCRAPAGPRPGPGSRPRRSKPAGWRPNRVPGAMNRRMGYIVGICWDAGSATFSRDSGSLLSCENSRGPKLSHTKGIRTAAEAQHTYPVVLGSDCILHV